MSDEKTCELDQSVIDGATSADVAGTELFLFSEPQLSLDLRIEVACIVCGSTFEISRRRGRPEKFCGDACRDAQWRKQKAAWHRKRQQQRKHQRAANFTGNKIP